jgi:hypothetical protein
VFYKHSDLGIGCVLLHSLLPPVLRALASLFQSKMHSLKTLFFLSVAVGILAQNKPKDADIQKVAEDTCKKGESPEGPNITADAHSEQSALNMSLHTVLMVCLPDVRRR